MMNRTRISNPARAAAIAAALAVLTAAPVVAGKVSAAPAVPIAAAQKAALEASRFGGHVHALAINPKTNELFLGARPIYRSNDGGKTWQAVEGIPKSEERANITSITIDPGNPQVMYATGHGIGVVKSTDGGKTWQRASSGLGGESTEAFAIDAKDPKTLYVWVLGEGLYRSKDAGASWQRVDDGPKQQEIRGLASVAAPTGMGGIWLYAGLDTGVMKSPDCFCGWDRLANAGLPDGRVYSLVVDPADPKTLYAGLRQGVFKSIDGAKTWTQATDLIEDAVVAVDASNPKNVHAVGSDGKLITSNDAGQTWRAVEVAL